MCGLVIDNETSKMCSRLESLSYIFKGFVINTIHDVYFRLQSITMYPCDDENHIPPSPSYSLPSPLIQSPISSPVKSSQNSPIIIESLPPSLSVEQEMVCYMAKGDGIF